MGLLVYQIKQGLPQGKLGLLVLLQMGTRSRGIVIFLRKAELEIRFC